MSSKFLDKTGLDTLWAKIKSKFQTLGNLVTTWGSTPSDTKYPSEKLVKASLDAISTNARTIPQDVSKGANLVVNGSGRMASNYNFSSFSYVPTISYGGSAGSFGYNATNAENEYISCDFNKKVVFSADVKNLVAQPSNCIHRVYVLEFDIDKKSINAIHVMYGVGTLTELTQDLNPGDTVVHLADLSNANWLSATTYHRGFIFWNYQNSYGYLYPPETYSRNVYPSGDSNPLWDVANVNVSAGTITLNSGWTGPTIPAGTKVSRRSSGNTYPYPTSVTTGDTEWHSMKGYMKGINSPGTSERSSLKFSQGTAFIRAGIYPSNLNNTDPVINKRAVVTNFAIYEEQDINDGFGTLPVNRGGTGATSAIGAEYNILNQVADIDTTINGDRKIALCNQTKSASNGVFRWLKLSNVWTWIKGLLSSESGVNISGNAATATTAAGYTSGGAIDTALQGKVDKVTGKGLSTNDYTTDEKNKLAVIAEGAEVNVQSDWNQTDSTADDYIKNKPKTVLWLTYGSTYTKTQVDGWITDGYLLCVSYNSRTYKLGRVTSYQDTNYYTFSDEMDYVRLTINNSTSAWTDGTNYPTAASIGAAESSHIHGSIANDGTSTSDPTSTTKFLRADGSWQVPAGTGAKEKSYYSSNSFKGVKFATTTVKAGNATSYGVFQFARLQIGNGIKTLSGNDNNPIVGIVQIFHRTNGSGETVAGNVMARITVFQSDFTGEIRVYYQINGDSVDWYIATTTEQTFVAWRTLKLFSSGTVVDIELSGVKDVSALTENNASYKTPLVAAASTGTGSNTQPVFVDSNGRLQACKKLVQAVTSIDTSNMDPDVLYVM